MKKHHIYLALLSCLFFIQEIKAQNSQVSSGNNASGSGGSSSYSIGQIVYSSTTNENNNSTEGNQQPFEIMVLSNEEIIDSNINLLAYPNPTKDKLHIRLREGYNLENLNYDVIDLNGKIILNKIQIISNEEIIDFSNLNIGCFMLKIYNDKGSIKTYKIIKK